MGSGSVFKSGSPLRSQSQGRELKAPVGLHTGRGEAYFKNNKNTTAASVSF